MILERNAEQLRCSGVGIDEPPGRVDRNNAAAYVPEDVSGLKANLDQLCGQLFRSSPRLAEASGDVRTPKRNRSEHTQLEPDAEVQLHARREDDIGGVEQAPKRSDQQSTRHRQEERRGCSHENVERGELRACPAGHVHDRRHDREVEQRLCIKEGRAKRRPVDDAVQRRSGRERQCDRDEQ
jgi:hypothetical protein